MTSEKMAVSSSGRGMGEALAMTEQIGLSSGLDRKQVLQFRLLAEELFGMLRSIAGEVEAEYWLEWEKPNFELHMNFQVEMTREMRRRFLSASAGGENAAAKGFMGKIRDMIAAVLLPSETGPAMFSAGLMSLGSPGACRAGACEWDMRTYKETIEGKASQDSRAAEAWDELEKSIVANIAYDVKVGISGSKVEMTVYKAFV